ncbi:MAG: 3-hydroxyacyl-CoA dehydrogenase/enoyl-CoA hydratase family protein [Deltaproteobacteria bacterium]|nr:3-hydroxyacyl-CoA dehydrogenase/enoyl-CoA hydratase family protein [Deltaproteobacteria bacterium]
MQGKPFSKVCVIGAGVMGSGIAAHLANARIPVLLLDIVPPKVGEGDDPSSVAFKNRFSKGGFDKAKKAKPAAFFSKNEWQYVEVGNLEDDLDKVKDCDWVIEVVIENLDIKQKLFERLEGVVHDEAIISSNTSGMSITGMLEGRSDSFKSRFLVSHFFNPVRYMHLLELVAGVATSQDVMDRMSWFGESILGKGIVYGKDTTNFVANRIGVYGMMKTMEVMSEGGYSIEEVDAVFGPNTGRPKSAVFRTADVVGLDTFAHVAQNCYDNLSQDEQHSIFKTPAIMTALVEKGWLGSKSKQGFYKKEGKEILALDVAKFKESGKLAYKSKEKVRYDSLGAVRKMTSTEEKYASLFGGTDKAADLFWNVTGASCAYSATRLGEIADDVVQIDNGMKWGFGWGIGPFESWDAMGVKASVERMEKDGINVPAWVKDMLAAGRESFYATNEDGSRNYWDPNAKKAINEVKSDNVKTFDIIKSNKTNVVKGLYSASLVDLGDGVLAAEFHGAPVNALDADVIEVLNSGLDMCEEGKFNSLIVANDSENFCVGANIFMIMMGIQGGDFQVLDDAVTNFQKTMQRLKYSHIPTVAAPFGLTLGGGAEVAMWCNKIRAHGELYMGLVEAGVGLLPGAGGNIEMVARTLENAPDDAAYPVEKLLQRAFENIAMAKVATSAEEARDLMFLAPSDGVTLNRRHLLEAVKQDALGMVRSGFRPPRPRSYRLPGRSAMATFDMVVTSMKDGNFISEHDALIAMKVASVLTGGDTSPRVKISEQHLLDLEREAFLSLCGEEKTQARIAFMLEKNKPLRN